MCSYIKTVCSLSAISFASFFCGFSANAQRSTPVPTGAKISPQQAITLAEQGHCRESISALRRAMVAQLPAET